MWLWPRLYFVLMLLLEFDQLLFAFVAFYFIVHVGLMGFIIISHVSFWIFFLLFALGMRCLTMRTLIRIQRRNEYNFSKVSKTTTTPFYPKNKMAEDLR